MALFLDTANLEEIRSAMELGIYAGVTTNPSLLEKVPTGERRDRLRAIAEVCNGSIYAQVDAAGCEAMEAQAKSLWSLAPGRMVIKVPLDPNGLRLCPRLRAAAIPACITAVFSAAQAFAAACAGAHAIAVYVGRISRRGEDGLAVVRTASEILRVNALPSRILAASIPDIPTLLDLLRIPGVDCTIPFRLQEPLLCHPGTDEALAAFAKAAR